MIQHPSRTPSTSAATPSRTPPRSSTPYNPKPINMASHVNATPGPSGVGKPGPSKPGPSGSAGGGAGASKSGSSDTQATAAAASSKAEVLLDKILYSDIDRTLSALGAPDLFLKSRSIIVHKTVKVVPEGNTGWGKFNRSTVKDFKDEHLKKKDVLAAIADVKLEDGCKAALASLHARKIPLVAVTGGMRDLAVQFLRNNDVLKYFTAVIGHDGCFGPDGYLKFSPLHATAENDATGCDFQCQLLCKSRCVREYEAAHKLKIKSRAFVGDGRQDCCVFLNELGKADHAFPKGQTAANIVKGSKKKPVAQVHFINKFEDVLKHF